MKRQRLLSIQFARGLAALLVAIYHATRMMSLPQYAGHEGLGGWFAFGYAGVNFFFVLSGFIIFFVHHRDLNRPGTLLRYGWRRITRIYPDYWLILAVVIVWAIVKHDTSLTAGHLLKSLFLLPDDGDPLLGVAWTLVYELLFYMIFALGIFQLRLGIAVAILWLVLISGLLPVPSTPFFRIVQSTLNLQFLMGIVAAKLVASGRVPFARGIAVVGIAAFLATGVAANAGMIGRASPATNMIFGVCAAITIVGIATAELQGRLVVGKIGEFFGGTSYLLYLVHTLAIGLVLQGLRVSGLVKNMPDTVIISLCVIAASLVAAFLYRYVDLPTQAALNRFGREHVFGRTQQRELS